MSQYLDDFNVLMISTNQVFQTWLVEIIGEIRVFSRALPLNTVTIINTSAY